MKLQGKVAVVTGGGRGIGRALCLAFADEGADVLVAADVESQVKAVAAEVEARRRKAIAYRFDVVKPDEVEELLNATLAAFGRVDVLVNCAGVVGKRAFAFDTDDAEWRRVIEVNLFGTYHCVKRFLPAMMRQGEGMSSRISRVSTSTRRFPAARRRCRVCLPSRNRGMFSSAATGRTHRPLLSATSRDSWTRMPRLTALGTQQSTAAMRKPSSHGARNEITSSTD